jgi:alpha-tubulin suppressor-like RCC1 family protein
MLKTGGAAVWVNYPCDTQYEAGKTCVCESPPATAPSVMVSPCPAGWHQYSADGKCYYLPEYASYSWSQCAGFCDANGVDMICTENAGQANFIRGVVGNNWVALGLKDNVGDGSYAWNAGCSSAYIAWANGQPTGGDERCAAIAPDGYADSYCSQPLEFFRCGCESTPTLAPVTMVGELRPALPSMLSSATYVVRNGFAFAALANDTSVHTWGESGMGGNSSSVQAYLQSGVVGIVHSKFAFAALAFDGTVYGWGDSTALVNIPSLDTIILMVGNGEAFACRSDTDRGVTSGSPHSGGVIPVAYSDLLASPKLRALAASSGAFAALMSDATVCAWGNKYTGGGVDLNPVPNLTGVVKVVANLEAFAAIDSFGGVTTWGAALSGGDSSSVASGLRQVVHVIGTRSAFAAFKADGSLVVWGYWKDGGDASAVSASLSSGVVAVAHTYTAMAALKADGTAVTWGRDTDGGDSSGVSLANLVSIVGNSKAFAAITASGGVVAWGRAAFGGTIPTDKMVALSSGVVSIHHTDRAFAALMANGALVVWGQAGHGGSPGAMVEALLTAGIHTVCANDAAFSAINAAGEVIAWGHAVVVPVPGVVYQSNSLMKTARCSAEVGGAVRLTGQ